MIKSCRIHFATLVLVAVASVFSSCHKGTNSVPAFNPQTSVLPTGINEGLESVFFVDSQTGYVGGIKGGIYKTVNGGQTWAAQNSGTSLPVYGIYFVNAQKGFAVGGDDQCGGTGCTVPGGFILETQNGGQSWTQVYTPTQKIQLGSIYFVNASTGFCVGDATILKTTNGGQSWTEYPIANLGGRMMQIKFIDSQKGYIVCLFDKIVQTNDGGISWQITSPQFNVGYYGVSAANGFAYVSGQGHVIKSTDNGSSWAMLPNAPVNIYSLYFMDANHGVAFGTGNYSGGDFGFTYAAMYSTADGGNTWTGSANISNFGLIQSLSFPQNNLGYGVCGGLLVKVSLE